MEDDLKILTRGLSQQPLIGTNSYFKINFRSPNYIVIVFQRPLILMEDNLKLLKVVYLSNYCMDFDFEFLGGK
jgi:hypothetical protein